jgi:hypothetical protein
MEEGREREREREKERVADIERESLDVGAANSIDQPSHHHHPKPLTRSGHGRRSVQPAVARWYSLFSY